jgi:ATP-dependent HslUV protease, peptidase subunit HslV
MPKSSSSLFRSTTVLAVLRDGRGAIGSDGQVTLGDTAVKHGAVKVRSLREGKVLAGFAGGAADALTLSEKFEGHLDRYQGHLRRATVELAREWRQDRILRRLEAMVLVMDHQDIFTVSGNGDILEAEHGLAAIGSGGGYALAAARGLIAHSSLDAAAICRTALEIAGDICIYTNRNITVLSVDGSDEPAPRKDA